MARIQINDLKGQKLSLDDIQRVTGGASGVPGVSRFAFGDGSVRPTAYKLDLTDVIISSYKI